ncbi:MAG: cytochrome c [Opitutaceae bacterium]
MKTTLRILGYIALGYVVLVAVGAVVIYSGSYNIAATTRHTQLVHASLNKLMINSVRSHAKDVVVPTGIDLRDREFARHAVGHFESMCLMCHGAPGRDPDRWSQSLYPPPPDLIHSLREHKWTDQEVFWIIKHGIKDTGMAAFGDSHDDRDLWALTALVRQFLEMSPDEYRTMAQNAQAEPSPQPTGREQPSQKSQSSPGHKH